MKKIGRARNLHKKVVVALVVGGISIGYGISTVTYGATPTHQYSTVSAQSSSAYSNERADLMSVTNDVVLPYFPELAYKPAPKSIVAEKALADGTSSFAKAGVLGEVKSNGLWGVIDTNGQVTVTPKYKKLEPAYNGTFYVKDNKKDIYQIDKTGKRLTSAEVETLVAQVKAEEQAKDKSKAGLLNESMNYPVLVPYKADKLIGFQNTKGQVIIPAQYKEVYTDFSEGLAFVKTMDNKKVAINEQGQIVFSAPYDELFAYNNGLAEYHRSVSGFNFGSLLGFVAGGYISGGHGWGFDGGIGGGFTYDGVKRGYLDRTGRIVVDSKLDAVYPMTPYGTAVKDKGQAGFVNREGKYIIPMGNYEIGTIDAYMGALSMTNKPTGKVGVFSIIDGTKMIDFAYDSIDFLGNGRLLAKQGNYKYLVDMMNGKSFKAFSKNTKVSAFGDEKVTWSDNGKKQYQIIDLNGNTVLNATNLNLQDVQPFQNGNSAVKVNGKWGVLTSTGNWLIQPTYDEINLL